MLFSASQYHSTVSPMVVEPHEALAFTQSGLKDRCMLLLYLVDLVS